MNMCNILCTEWNDINKYICKYGRMETCLGVEMETAAMAEEAQAEAINPWFKI